MYIYTFIRKHIHVYAYMYICVYIYMYIHIYVYIFSHLLCIYNIRIYVYIFVYMYRDIYISICIYIYIYIYIDIYIHICIHEYTYIYIHMYSHTHGYQSTPWISTPCFSFCTANSPNATLLYFIASNSPTGVRSHAKKIPSPVQRDSLRLDAKRGSGSGENLLGAGTPSWMSAPIKPGQFAGEERESETKWG